LIIQITDLHKAYQSLYLKLIRGLGLLVTGMWNFLNMFETVKTKVPVGKNASSGLHRRKMWTGDCSDSNENKRQLA